MKTTEKLPITSSQKSQFLNDGFIRLDQVISDHELEWYRERYDACFEDESRIKQLGGKDAQGRAGLPQILAPHKEMADFLEQPYLKRLERIAEYILGEDATFVVDHMILKPAGHGIATPWHQDQAYHSPDKYYRNINFWLPLEGATVEGGCMHYVKNTHRGTLLPHRYLIPGDSRSALVADRQDYWAMNSDALNCPVGSVCLHHSYCMHYAGPNETEVPRRAYIVIIRGSSVPLERPFHLPWQENPFWPEN